MRRLASLALCLVVTGSMVTGPALPARAAPTVEYRFAVATRGPVQTDAGSFADTVTRILADGRGWALDGRVAFTRVESAGDFTVWLATASSMRSFGPPCHPRYSCRSGGNVIINEDRWAGGSPPWHGPLDDYRAMVVNHETGHWLGLGHGSCGGAGEAAPVMMQQSKGTAACAPNPWPLPEERQALERRLRPSGAAPAPPVQVVGVTSRPSGWWTVTSDGVVEPDGLGNAPSGDVVGMAATSSGGGYWVAAGDGAVFAFGDAPYLGRAEAPSRPVVAVAATPSGAGYWLAAGDGGVFAFGDAPFLGRAEGPSAPVVGVAGTPSGQGYWLVSSDGAVFAFGDAPFLGRPEALNQPVVGIAGSRTGQGYWLAAADGGIFAFGDARYYGPGPSGTADIAPTPGGAYRLVASDGTVVTYG